MRYQQIAKLIMRNKDADIRHLVQMHFCHQMPQHLSLVLARLHLPQQAQKRVLVDGPDRKVLVLDQETLKQVSEIPALDGEQIRCAITVKT